MTNIISRSLVRKTARCDEPIRVSKVVEKVFGVQEKNDDGEEVSSAKYRKKKKKIRSKVKKPFIIFPCLFCGADLREKFFSRQETCLECGAKEIECPACKRNGAYEKDGVIIHRGTIGGCGFKNK